MTASDNALPTLVVATDGSPASTSALAAANLIAEINDVDVEVVSLENAPNAQVQDAELIIVGAGSHGVLHRLAGGEDASRIAQLRNIPVLVAAAGIQRLPHRIAIAMDLDPSQLGDLPPVLSLFGPAASVACVHVKVREHFPGSESAAFARAYENAVAESFGVTQAAIATVPGMRAELIRLSGDPVTELIRYAERAKVELLVLGLRRHYGLRRLIGGSVGLKVLRGVSCSVLIVPESASTSSHDARKKEAQSTTFTTYDDAMWLTELKKFTQRNAGRHATLEVDGADIGVVLQVGELPFIGADYDHRDGRVDIMLGDFAGSERHLTRSILHPGSISLLRGPESRDDVLCVTYPGGQTLLAFK